MMRYRKSLLLLTACASVLLMSSCGDTVVESSVTPPKDPISTEATLNVTVRDNSTGKTIDGAKVTLLTEIGERKTGSSSDIGTVTFENIYVGEQNVLIEKAGYASAVYPVTIGRDDKEVENFYIAQETSRDFQLYPLTSKLDGTLYYLKDNKSEKAKSATVRVTLPAYIVNKIREVKTDTNGVFRFDSLPAVGSVYELTALDLTVGGVTYTSVTGETPALTPNATAHVKAKFEYAATTAPFTYRGASPLVVERTRPVVLTFSDKIDTTKITRNPVSVNPPQPIVVRYSGDTLTITPQPGGGWVNGSEITITDDLKSSNLSLQGAPVTIRLDIRTGDLSLTPVTKLVIDAVPPATHGSLGVTVPHYYSDSVNIKWGRIVGDVDRYEVFYKEDGSQYYKSAKIVWGPRLIDSTYYATVETDGGSQIRGKTNTFMVQAVNGQSRSAVNTADTLKVFARPTLTATVGSYAPVGKVPQDTAIQWGGSSAAQTDFERWLYRAYSGSTTDSRTFVVTFTEPMDFANLAASGTWVNNANQTTAKITITATPGDELNNYQDTKMTVRAAVNADPGETPNLNAVWRFSGLKSKSGKDFFIEYTEVDPTSASLGVTKIVKNTLDLRIKATQP